MSAPALRVQRVLVRVPATSANLGPGFDAMGLALDWWDEVEVTVTAGGLSIEVAGEGARQGERGAVPLGERHLIVRALRTGFDALGGQPAGLHLACRNEIPHSRGLGSSAAAIVAGLVAAQALAASPYDDATLLAIASDMEGHPDNAAAALHGGCVLAWCAGRVVGVVDLTVHPDIRPVVLVPDERSSTKRARGLLPAQVPFADAVTQASRAALLVEALCRRPDLLLTATEDRLHQPYRAEAMVQTAGYVEALRAGGIAAVVSGAGPSVLALCVSEDQAARAEGLVGCAAGWRALRLPVATTGAHARPC